MHHLMHLHRTVVAAAFELIAGALVVAIAEGANRTACQAVDFVEEGAEKRLERWQTGAPYDDVDFVGVPDEEFGRKPCQVRLCGQRMKH